MSTLTGTQVLLLVVSETGLVYTFTTPKLQPLVTKSEGKNLIQACLHAPDKEPTPVSFFHFDKETLLTDADAFLIVILICVCCVSAVVGGLSGR